MRFYRIMFSEKIETLHHLNESVTEEQLIKNLSSGAIMTGVEGKDGELIGYLLCDLDKLHIIRDYLDGYGLIYQLTDFTDEVLNCSMIINDYEAQELLDKLRWECLTVDHVLDKMNRYGLGALDELDRKILEEY